MNAAQQSSPAPQDEEQSRSFGGYSQTGGHLVLDDALRRRIAEAVQPLVEQVRRTADLAAEQRLHEEPQRSAAQTQDSTSDEQHDQEPAPQEVPTSSQETSGSAEASSESDQRAPAEGEQEATSSTQGADQQAPEAPIQPAREQAADTSSDEERDEDGGQEEGGLFSDFTRSVGEALQTAVRQEAGDPLHTLFHAGLDRLFSSSFEEALKPQVEATLWMLLDSLLENVDNEALRHALRTEGVEVLSTLLSRSFDAVFTDPVCQQLERYGDRAIDHLLAGDAAASLRDVTRASRVVLPRLVGALENQWGLLLPFVAKVAFAVVRETVESAIKEGLGITPSLDREEIGERVESVHDRVEDAADDLRMKLTDVAEELRSRIQEEKENLRERISEGVKSAMQGGSRGPGGQPAGRPPFGRPLNGRPPSLRAPSGRPPSASRLGAPAARRRQ